MTRVTCASRSDTVHTRSKNRADMSRVVPEEQKKLLRSVLLSVVGGIKISEIHKQYKNITDERLDWIKLGFKNAVDMLSTIPDVARLVALFWFY